MAIIDFSQVNDWGSGFTASLKITNDQTTALKDWTLKFEAPFEITEDWGVDVVSRQGNIYTLRSADWATNIPPGQSVTFGFNANKTGTGPVQPTNFVLNGQPINGGAAPTPAPTPGTPASDDFVMHLTFDNVSGQKISDASPDGRQNPGLLAGDAKLKSADGRGKVLQLNTNTDYAYAADSTDINTGVHSDRTVAVWFKADNVSGGKQVIYEEGGAARGLNIYLEGGKLHVGGWNQPESKWNGTFFSTENITSGQWHHVALTLDAKPNEKKTQAGAFTAYLDGQQFGQGAGSQLWQHSDDIGIGAVRGGTRFENGTASGNVKFGLTGSLDDLRVYNQALTQNQIEALANPPAGDNNPPDNPPDNPPGGSPIGLNYGEALQKSFLFYEAQRSGNLPGDNRIDWRGDSALGDGSDVGRDLSGGYYDAGDTVKFGFPMAASMTMLAWGVDEYRGAYQKSGQLDESLDAIKWGTDYLLKAHETQNGKTKAFWAQVGAGDIDHQAQTFDEAMSFSRPSFKVDAQNPGSDVTAETAAALAAASIIFRPTNKSYADKLLTNAKQLYDFADTYRGKYSDSIADAGKFYNSWSGYGDELTWGATWLYKATGDNKYLAKAEQTYTGVYSTQSWDNKELGSAVLLSQITDKTKYRQDTEKLLNDWANGTGGIKYTQGGLAWHSQWGSVRTAGTAAFVAGVYGDTVNDPGQRYTNFSEKQIDYILGKNPNKFSYMVGFGDNFAKQPHHRAATGYPSFNDPRDNRHTIYGAVVGGPTAPDDNAYQDIRSDYVANEVALDYNVGITGALARQYDQFGGNPLTDAQLNALPGISVNN